MVITKGICAVRGGAGIFARRGDDVLVTTSNDTKETRVNGRCMRYDNYKVAKIRPLHVGHEMKDREHIRKVKLIHTSLG